MKMIFWVIRLIQISKKSNELLDRSQLYSSLDITSLLNSAVIAFRPLNTLLNTDSPEMSNFLIALLIPLVAIDCEYS